MKKVLTTIFILVGIAPFFVLACEKEKVDCGSVTFWHEGNSIELNMNDEQSQNKSRWHMKLYSGNDIIIEKDEKYQGQSIQGVLGIIGGRMMITKGLELRNGYEIDAADGPALMIQLMLRLLSEVAPEGPLKITAPIDINHKEPKKGIKLTTAAASAVFGTPWSVTGTLAPGQDSVINYSLNFTSKVGEKDYKLLLTGTWAKDNALGKLSGDKKITDWQVYKIGPYTKKYKGGTIYDYGAQPVSETFNNVAALRSYIAEQQKFKRLQRTELTPHR